MRVVGGQAQLERKLDLEAQRKDMETGRLVLQP